MTNNNTNLTKKGELLEEYSQDTIQSRILTIRGQQVIMDADLAEFYQVKTIALNQAVKRNEVRFPQRYRFQLTEDEKQELITNCDRFKSLKQKLGVFFDGQMFDAFVLVEELIQKATKRIILIDDYITASLLQRFHKRSSGVTLDCYVKTRFATSDLQEALPHPSSPARRGSTSPPKYFGFAEVLHARQCSNAFDIALA